MWCPGFDVLNTSKLCKNLSLYGGVCSPMMRCVNARERSELMQEQCMPHCARRLHQEISQAHVRPLPRASFSFPKPPAPSHIQQAPPRHGSAGQMTPSTACIVRFNCLKFSSRAVSNRTCRDNHKTDFAPFIQNSPVEYRWPRTQTGSIVAGASLELKQGPPRRRCFPPHSDGGNSTIHTIPMYVTQLAATPARNWQCGLNVVCVLMLENHRLSSHDPSC
jgi:hypothetical protein